MSDPDFRAWFECSPEPQVVVLADSPCFTVVAASEGFVRAAKQSREALLGRSVGDLSLGDGAVMRELGSALERSVHGGATHGMPVPRGEEAESPWWRPTCCPIVDDHGRIAWVHVRWEDVDDLVASQRTLERGIEARDAVLGAVAHDLRNSIHTVELAAGVLRALVADAPAPRPLTMIERAVSCMRRLVADMFDTALLQAGQVSLDSEVFDPELLVAEAMDAASLEVAAAGLVIECQIDDDLAPVHGDYHRLLRVFDNLIGNAIKFTPSGGRIRIGARRRADWIECSVADTGTGIPPHQLPHVFERFWQARDDDHRGAGMGLSIVRQIIEAHSGRIWVRSEPGRGSIFSFAVPCAASRAQYRSSIESRACTSP